VQIGMFDSVTVERPTCFYDLECGKNRAKFSARTPKALIYFSQQYQIPVISSPDELSRFEVVLFSLHCFRDFYLVAELAKHKRPGQEWVAGGNAAATPRSVLWIMDHVWVGDCIESFPEILRGRRDFPSMAHATDPDATVVYADEDMSEKLLMLNDSEIEMSKGCPRRCLFCIHPWRHRYQEADRQQVLDYIRKHPRKGVGLMSNSSDDVSYYNEVAAELLRAGKTDMVVSNAVQGLTKKVLASRKREVLLGVEGMSQRLRRAVNKRDVLRERVGWALEAKVQVRTVYQFNLPGETEDDFNELMDDVSYLRSRYKTGSWAIPFIPNQTSAHTPFQYVVPRYSVAQMRRIQKFRESLFGSRTSGVSIYVPQPLGPANWFSQIIAEWIPITPQVSRVVARMPHNVEVDAMVKHLRRNGVELPPEFFERGESTVFPWSNVVTSGEDADKFGRFRKMRDYLASDRFRLLAEPAAIASVEPGATFCGRPPTGPQDGRSQPVA
jgi:hypothetical protein